MSSKHRESKTSHPKDLGSNKTRKFFVPRDGIDHDVIKTDIGRYLGKDAFVKPGPYQDPTTGQLIQGYYIFASRNLDSLMIQSLRNDSAKRSYERTSHAIGPPSTLLGENGVTYPRSDTHVRNGSGKNQQAYIPHHNIMRQSSKDSAHVSTQHSKGRQTFASHAQEDADAETPQDHVYPSYQARGRDSRIPQDRKVSVSQWSTQPSQSSQYGYSNSMSSRIADFGDDTTIPDPYDPDTENHFDPPLPNKEEPGYGAWGRERPVKHPGPVQDPRPPPRIKSGVTQASFKLDQDGRDQPKPVSRDRRSPSSEPRAKRGVCPLCLKWRCSCAIRGDRNDPNTGIGAPVQGSAGEAQGVNLASRSQGDLYCDQVNGYDDKQLEAGFRGPDILSDSGYASSTASSARLYRSKAHQSEYYPNQFSTYNQPLDPLYGRDNQDQMTGHTYGSSSLTSAYQYGSSPYETAAPTRSNTMATMYPSNSTQYAAPDNGMTQVYRHREYDRRNGGSLE